MGICLKYVKNDDRNNDDDDDETRLVAKIAIQQKCSVHKSQCLQNTSETFFTIGPANRPF